MNPGWVSQGWWLVPKFLSYPTTYDNKFCKAYRVTDYQLEHDDCVCR